MVVVYVTTAIGIPVYKHYCGGELEKVSLLIKSNSCCGGEEDDMNMDCCANENTFVRCAPDFTFTKAIGSNFQIADINLFIAEIPFINTKAEPVSFVTSKYFFPPPDILHSNIIRTTFLKI